MACFSLAVEKADAVIAVIYLQSSPAVTQFACDINQMFAHIKTRTKSEYGQYKILLPHQISLSPSFILLGSYIPEGLMTSCTWDYVTYTLANRSYTMMLCCFVFFIPLGIIFYCYVLMFLAIRRTSRYCCVGRGEIFLSTQNNHRGNPEIGFVRFAGCDT